MGEMVEAAPKNRLYTTQEDTREDSKSSSPPASSLRTERRCQLKRDGVSVQNGQGAYADAPLLPGHRASLPKVGANDRQITNVHHTVIVEISRRANSKVEVGSD
jgi:hypothetical protein